MRIILNSRLLSAPRAGIGTYIAELAGALQQHRALELEFFDGRAIQRSLHGGESTVRKEKWPEWFRDLPGAYAARRYVEQKRFDTAAKKSQPDLYHEPTLWPLQFDGPTVMTVHDLTHINYRHTQPPARVREIERRLPRALERVARVLVDSQFIGHELQRHFDVPMKKIVVAPLAPGDDFEPRRESQLVGTLQRFELNYRRYFLFIGTLEPRKNLTLALRAHAGLPQSIRRQFPLIVVGGTGWLAGDIERELATAIAAGDVRRLGYVDRADLADILGGAKSFIFPSLYEGFGLPVLEAMASGIPVISSTAACLPEIGGDAIRYVDPFDSKELSRQMQELIDDAAECERLIAAGIERAKLFSWQRCAEITAQAYREALAV